MEVIHTTTDALKRTFDAVLVQHDPDPLKQNVIAGIVDGRALAHAELVQHWKEQAARYPDGLAVAVINRFARIDHFWRWELWLQRSANLMMLYQSFAQVQQQLLHTLLGLNHVYYFGFKWLDLVAERLPYKPADLVARLALVYQQEPAAGAHELQCLVEETYNLVERYRPEVDVARLHTIFQYRRPVWDHVPPGTDRNAHE